MQETLPNPQVYREKRKTIAEPTVKISSVDELSDLTGDFSYFAKRLDTNMKSTRSILFFGVLILFT
jgi:hypothetical protein